MSGSDPWAIAVVLDIESGSGYLNHGLKNFVTYTFELSGSEARSLCLGSLWPTGAYPIRGRILVGNLQDGCWPDWGRVVPPVLLWLLCWSSGTRDSWSTLWSSEPGQIPQLYHNADIQPDFGISVCAILFPINIYLFTRTHKQKKINTINN